jgi:hypothetical protein
MSLNTYNAEDKPSQGFIFSKSDNFTTIFKAALTHNINSAEGYMGLTA